jgi:hypothetical protein
MILNHYEFDFTALVYTQLLADFFGDSNLAFAGNDCGLH